MFSQTVGSKSSNAGKKKANPQKTGPGSQTPPRILQVLWGFAGGFCRIFCILENLLKTPHTTFAISPETVTKSQKVSDELPETFRKDIVASFLNDFWICGSPPHRGLE